MRSGFFLLLAVLSLAALAALLWWRLRGSGQPAAPAVLHATRNHWSLRTRHYQPATPAPAIPAPAATLVTIPVGENAPNRLLPPEDWDARYHAPDEDGFAAATHPDLAADPGTHPDEPSRPTSISDAPGRLASLLDALDEEPARVGSGTEPGAEADEAPAASLFYNPLTAPAPTANDQANRAAEIALRQQRRARMSAGAAAQRTALSELFPGAGRPIPADTST